MKKKSFLFKALMGITVPAVLLAGCGGQGESVPEGPVTNGLGSIESGVPFTQAAGTQAPEAAQWPAGDKTIHTAIRLDTAEFDAVGPLIGDKALTFKNAGEPYFTAAYPSMLDGSLLTEEIGAQEIGILDCVTGEKTAAAQVEPMVRLEAYALTESPYAAVVYTKKPEGLADTLPPEEYEALVKQTDTTLLWIDTRTGESWEYSFKPTYLPDFFPQDGDRFYKMELIQNDALLLYYTAYRQADEASGNTSRCLDKLTLSTGEITDLSAANKEPTLPYSDTTEDSFVFSSDGERLYQRYSRWETGRNVYGFRILDENLKVLEDVEVLRSPVWYGLNVYRDIQDVRVELLWMEQEMDEGADKSHQYFLYRQKDGRYALEPWDWEKSQLINMYPGTDSRLPYLIEAGRNSQNVPVLTLRGNGTDLEGLELELDIPEFKDAFYFYGTQSNCAGGTLIGTRSDAGENAQRGYWHVPRQEILRALGRA